MKTRDRNGQRPCVQKHWSLGLTTVTASEGLEQVSRGGVFRKGRLQMSWMAAASLGKLEMTVGSIPSGA